LNRAGSLDADTTDRGSKAEPAVLLKEATMIVAGLQALVARATIFLPPYDQRLSSDMVVSLHETIGKARNSGNRISNKFHFAYSAAFIKLLTSRFPAFSSGATACLPETRFLFQDSQVSSRAALCAHRASASRGWHNFKRRAFAGE
jgi:hypothetical protein